MKRRKREHEPQLHKSKLVERLLNLTRYERFVPLLKLSLLGPGEETELLLCWGGTAERDLESARKEKGDGRS